MTSSQNDEHQELFLDDVWSIYFHDPDDRDWTINSYKKIATVSSAEEFWGIHKMIRDYTNKGMFFIMREHVFPCWDDPTNIEGGCLSLMVPKDDVPQTWETYCVKMLTERLARDEKMSDIVNGMSISPKNDFCILKIWVRTGELNKIEDFDAPDHTSGMFTLNRAKIASTT
nr:eukaryotic initiation factor 4E [Oceanusvirus sp.]